MKTQIPHLRTLVSVALSCLLSSSPAYEKIIFAADVFFESRRVEVNVSGQESIKGAVSRSLKTFGEKQVCVLIIGNADPAEGEGDLDALSLSRANEVASFVRSQLPSAKTYVEGKGVTQLLSPSPNSRNARVEAEF